MFWKISTEEFIPDAEIYYNLACFRCSVDIQRRDSTGAKNWFDLCGGFMDR